ncbi:MAG: NUDIX hydrolase [Fidelibacterota bacterium]
MDIITLSQKLQDRLTKPLPGEEFQQTMLARPRSDLSWLKRDVFHPAAVLILFFPHRTGIRFFLTQRTTLVQHHKGQVSLPGGAWESGETLEETALRETEEEMGIPRKGVTLLGPLSPLPVPVTGFMIHPFVGVSTGEPVTNHAVDEVARIFKISLTELLDDSRVETEVRMIRGTPFQVPFFHFDEVKVWGATSMILAELKQALVECL